MDLTSVLSTLSFEDILDDLATQFIINVPDVELAKVERICFQVEQAHWFYEDFIRELRPIYRPSISRPSHQKISFFLLLSYQYFQITILSSFVTLNSYSLLLLLFKQCPLLSQWAHKHDKAYTDFMTYRLRVPVCGAIILKS
ncbi:unnamed protein product [Absidia cylindrospora]